jgi:hypothetical protein
MTRVERLQPLRLGLLALALTAAAGLSARAAVSAQATTGRLATNVEALVTYPVFFHGKPIAVRQDVEPSGQLYRLTNTAKPIYVFWRGAPDMPRDAEIRGEFWDLGRLQRDDPRFANVDLEAIVATLPNRSWPGNDQVLLITNATAVESPLPAEPTVRAIALAPDAYVGKGVTVTGRFRGANLFADLPSAAGTTGRWDFVLQSADAAVWVTGVRPRGRGFDLDVHARMDAGRWLQVAGTLRRDGPLPFIDATSIAEGKAPTEAPVEIVLPPPPAQPPPVVVFSAPLADETDAERTMPIRLQFSRDMDPKSFANHVHVSYVGPAPPDAPPMPAVTVRYIEGNRALEITPAEPLDRFRTVKVDLLPGIVSNIDGQPLAPYTLTFTTGG